MRKSTNSERELVKNTMRVLDNCATNLGIESWDQLREVQRKRKEILDAINKCGYVLRIKQIQKLQEDEKFLDQIYKNWEDKDKDLSELERLLKRAKWN